MKKINSQYYTNCSIGKRRVHFDNLIDLFHRNNYINFMSNLELFSKLKKRRNHSILTEAPEKLFKNASEHHKYNSFYRVQKGTQLSST